MINFELFFKKTNESSASLSFHLSRLTIRCLEETIKLFAKKIVLMGDIYMM
jgi:hypothetical protein